MAVAVFLTAMALLSLVGAVPVPNTQEITLQVPSELLKEHTLVLTLSPLPSTGKSLGEGEASGAAASAEGSPDEGPTKTEGETALTTIEPNTTTSANKTTSGTPSDFLRTTVAPPVILPPLAKGDGDTSGAIVQIPNRNKCPEGHAPDANGICRQLFKPTLSAAKSLDNSVDPELLPQAVDIQD